MMISRDKHGRAVPVLRLDTHEQETLQDQQARMVLMDLLEKVQRNPTELMVNRTLGSNSELPCLDASGVLYEGLNAIQDFAHKELLRHLEWVKMFPERSKLPVFGHPYAR